MYGQNNNNQNYGWGNAVADILGAVMQRNQNRVQADVMSDPLGWAQKQGQSTPQQEATAPPTNQGLLQKESKSLLGGITNFAPQLAQQPNVNNIGSQLMTTNPSNSNFGLLSNTAFNLNQPTPEQNQQQSQFDAAVKANPEWYRKGVSPNSLTYVGDRPDITKDATVTASGNAVDLSQPKAATPTATQQQSSIPDKNVIRKQYKVYGSAAIKKLVSSGMSPKEAIGLVQNSINQRTEEDFAAQSEEYAQQLDSQLDPLMGLDFQTSGNKAKMLATLAKYNQGMKRIGREGADLSLMKDLMSQGDVVMQKEDNGGQYRYVMVKKNGERFDDGSFQMAVPGNAGEWTDKQLTPGEVQTGQIHRENMQNQREIASMRGSNGFGSVGGTSAQKMSMYKWASGYSIQPTGEVDYSGKPVMTRVQNNPQLAAQLAQELGYGGQGGGQGESGGQTVQSTGDSRIDGMIENMRNSGAPEQVINDMVWEEQNRGQNQAQPQAPRYREYGTESTPDMLQPQDRTVGKMFEPMVNFFKNNASQYDEYGRPR